MDSMDQGGIKWGAEIAVNNCKPDWVVQDDTPVWWQDEKGQSNVSTTARLVWQQSGGDLIKIKLPADHPHYQKQATVDWSKPIEAVHVDGRVQSVRAVGKDMRTVEPFLEDDGLTVGFFRSDGTHKNSRIRWTIRNVQTPEAATPAIDPALVERMRQMIAKMATRHKVWESDVDITRWCDEARDILKALKPVDGDLLEARRMVAETYGDSGSVAHLVKQALSGEGDEWFHTKVALAAIRRGRALERGDA